MLLANWFIYIKISFSKKNKISYEKNVNKVGDSDSGEIRGQQSLRRRNDMRGRYVWGGASVGEEPATEMDPDGHDW